MRAVVVADTHRTAARAAELPARLYALLEGADVILHAGDIVADAVLDVLAQHAPVHAVLGNNDAGMALPATLELDLAQVRIAMIHDSGPANGREQRLKRRFPTADVVVFGHSHIPWNQPGLDGQLLFNPGSPTQARRQPHATAGLLELDGGLITRAEIVVVDP